MKSYSSLALASLLSLFAVNSVSAQTQTNSVTQQQSKQIRQYKQNQQKQQAQQKQAQQKQAQQKQAQQTNKKQEQKNQPNALTADEALKQFNDSMTINFLGYQVVTNENPHLLLRYDLINKSKKDIAEVSFISAFTAKEQIFYAQEIPLTFNTPLKKNSNITLDISVPMNKLPEHALPILSEPNAQIGIINGAQLLMFTDKTKLEIK